MWSERRKEPAERTFQIEGTTGAQAQGGNGKSEVATEAAVAAAQGVRHSKRVVAIVHIAQEQV